MSTLTTPRPTRSTPVSRLSSLATSETRQFLRNRSLLFTAVLLPPLMPVALFLITLREDVPAEEEQRLLEYATVNAAETFIMFLILFVPFYSVLSMVAARRDEQVLKRLRSGESRDGEILASLAAPGAVLAVGISVGFVLLLMALGAPAPLNVVPMIAAVVLGTVLAVACALLTAGFTRNAEAAQITSLPVLAVAMGTMTFRNLYPDAVVRIIDWTPFALVADLFQIGWAGETVLHEHNWNSLQILTETAPMIAALAAWSLVLLVIGVRTLRWDNRT